MKRLFISQPMRDKTNEEILIERGKAVKVAKEMLRLLILSSGKHLMTQSHFGILQSHLNYLLQQM